MISRAKESPSYTRSLLLHRRLQLLQIQGGASSAAVLDSIPRGRLNNPGQQSQTTLFYAGVISIATSCILSAWDPIDSRDTANSHQRISTVMMSWFLGLGNGSAVNYGCLASSIPSRMKTPVRSECLVQASKGLTAGERIMPSFCSSISSLSSVLWI